MTIAVADWLANTDRTEERLVETLVKWGQKYPYAGYGGVFCSWLMNPSWLRDFDGTRLGKRAPYHSWGNGSAMRVSSVGWLCDSLEETRRYARLTAEVTHNHPEGIKGAQATAACIFLARTGKSKEEIRNYVEQTFGYDLHRTCDEIRPNYQFEVSCQKSVPESIIAFLESSDYESAIRLAVSMGGDADTMGAIAGGIAEAFYGVPEEMKAECRKRLPKDMLAVLDRFENLLSSE
jgi:ADP-ribosylglycohydrolase